MALIKRIKRIFKEPSRSYLHDRALAINEKGVLFEGGQGKNSNGNMFALLRELRLNKAYDDYTLIWVCTKSSMDKFKDRLNTYKITNIKLVIRESKEYTQALARFKYLFNDNSFPPFFHKREEQIYTNTWHGTPIKKLGLSDLDNAESLANIQKNYAMCDYACFPNDYTKKIFMKDYSLHAIYQGNIVMCDYPRNDVFHHPNSELHSLLGFDNKKIYAYMPTWRGEKRKADIELQSIEVQKYLEEIDKTLLDDELLLVNFHFLLQNQIVFNHFKHIQLFPEKYEVYDVLAQCDGLISDYSSVIFDYALLNKPIVLFAYDEHLYEVERGMYLQLSALKLPLVKEATEVIGTIRNSTKKLAPSFIKEFVQYDNSNTCAKILDCVINGNTKGVLVKSMKDQKPKNIVLYLGNLRNERLNEKGMKYIKQVKKEYKGHNIIVAIRGANHKRRIEFLKSLDDNISILGIVSKYNFTIKERIYSKLAIRFKSFQKLDERLLLRYRSEFERLFYRIPMEVLINYSQDLKYISKVLAFAHCNVQVHFHPNTVLGLESVKKAYPLMMDFLLNYYPVHFDHRIEDVKTLKDDELKPYFYNKLFKMGNVLYYIQNNGNGLHIRALCVYVSLVPFNVKDIKLEIGGYRYELNLKKGLKLRKNVYLSMYNFTIPYEDVKNFNIHTKFEIVYQESDGYGLRTGIKYNLFDKRKTKYRNGPIKMFEQEKTSAYMRQSKNNVLYLCVRKSNQSDHRKVAIKIHFAYLMAKLFGRMHKITLCFEKESERYEESASVLFEKCIDEKVKNIYFILEKDYPYMADIEPKYRKHIIKKGSYKHYYYFFSAKTFLGSEALVHAIDLRIANKYAYRKLTSKALNYVFLQHGVMYMVSLDSNSRTFFSPLKLDGLFRVVVSSEKEAKHFIELGKYPPSSLYISGLPKYDRNKLSASADQITIMLTWRPWEYNEARIDLTITKQFKMLERIVKAIPQKYHDKISILVHPLISDALKNEDHSLKAYINNHDRFDTILENTCLFISDYSSITYDAFYRGSNVIFCWEEKEECLINYGDNSKLMLNEDNTFGDIAHTVDDLKALVPNNYKSQQLLKYKDNYKRIVMFDDNNNTQRLFDMLKKDKLI